MKAKIGTQWSLKTALTTRKTSIASKLSNLQRSSTKKGKSLTIDLRTKRVKYQRGSVQFSLLKMQKMVSFSRSHQRKRQSKSLRMKVSLISLEILTKLKSSSRNTTRQWTNLLSQKLTLSVTKLSRTKSLSSKNKESKSTTSSSSLLSRDTKKD